MRWGYLGLAIGLAGCAATAVDPRSPIRSVDDLDGRDFYLCCNFSFPRSGITTDANYRYVGELTISAGTKVRVTSASSSAVAFTLPDVPGYRGQFRIDFEYGDDHLDALEYYRRILRSEDPRLGLSEANPEIQAGVTAGRIERGMTRDQVAMARGYPPAHKTPDLSAKTWLYYTSPGLVERVDFADGTVEAVLQGIAP